MRKNKIAQSILEYVLIFGVVATALSMMQIYFKRSIQAAVKIAADDIGSQATDEEVDPIRGRKTSRNSQIHKFTSGSRGDNQLAGGATERVRVFTGGGRRTDTYKDITTQGTASYEVLERQ